MALTDNRGGDVAIEAIGISAGFDTCQMKAYDTIGNAMKEQALKIIITND